jgi:hypothetical protein
MLEEKSMKTTETKIEHRLMTDDERLDTMYQAALLIDEDYDKAHALIASVPLKPELAKIGKEVYGADFLIEHGYNLLEANKAYGEDWLYK